MLGREKSKTLITQIYNSAKSSDAKKFLQDLVVKASYKIKSIQMDGGSEFMADFEDKYSKLNIPLYVLPPATPKYNGEAEFCGNLRPSADSIKAIRVELQKMLRKYSLMRA